MSTSAPAWARGNWIARASNSRTPTPDSGKASGKEYDVSATVTVGYGVSVSGSVGFGETSGKTDWVNEQTRVIARERLDIRTEEHTQIDGAVIASETGNLRLDTDTLGFRDIQGEERERSYYLNVGGSYGKGQQDQSQVGKGSEGQTGWSLEGYQYEREREQVVRATVGEGAIIVRSDAETGSDSTAGLNRDVDSAYQITKDEESRTDLYVSSSSLEAVEAGAKRIVREIQAQRLDIDQIPESARQSLGDERAQAVAKNLIRHGLDPSLLEQLSPELAGYLNTWGDSAEGIYAQGTGNGQTAGGVSESTSASGSGNVEQLPTTTVIADLKGGEVFLQQTRQLQQYLSELSVEEAQLALVAMQAMMGPAKAAVTLAGNMVMDWLLGDEIAAVKEAGAIAVAAGLSGETRAETREYHEQAKAGYASGSEEHFAPGDEYVLASQFLIELVAGDLGSLGRKVAGKTAGVVSGAGGKGSPLPTASKTPASNGLDYQSNPKHTPGQPGYGYRAGTEPKNSIELFGASIQSGKKRYAKDEFGNVHQFTNTNDGTWHWSGSTGDKSAPLNKNTIPPDVKKKLGLPKKGW